MESITVTEYCKRHNVSTQSVYSRIKRGTIEHEVVNGVKMVFDGDVAQTQSVPTPIVNDYNDVIDLMQSIIDNQQKEIKRLIKRINKLEKNGDKNADVLREILLGKIKPIQLEQLGQVPIDVDVDIDVEQPKKKKKSKKKSKKKR